MRKLTILLALLVAATIPIEAQLIPVAGQGGTSFTGGAVTTAITSPGYVAKQTLGTEVVTHTLAAWSSRGAGWSCAGTSPVTLTAAGAISTAAVNPAATVTALITYQLDYTITRTAGSITPQIGGTSGTAVSATGTYTDYITAGATTAVTFATSGFTGTVTAVSVKPITSTISSDAGPLVFKPSTSIRLVPASTYGIQMFGSVLFGFDNTNDIGASGATRPRTGYFGTSVISPIIDSGAATNLLLKYNGTTKATIGSADITIATATNFVGGGGVASGFKVGSYNTGFALGTTVDNGYLFGNNGAVARQDYTLPSAATGYNYSFVVNDADGIRITAAAGDTIRMGPKVTAAAGYIESTTIGSTVTLVAINATEWIATTWNGTWSDGTFTASNAANFTP